MAKRQEEARRKRIYRFPDLAGAGVPFTPKHVRDLERHGEFPQRVQLGPHSIGWPSDEVDQWVADKIAARRVVPLGPRLPGRPPKLIGVDQPPEPPPLVRRGPGRPRKEASEQPPPVRRGPGRPRKIGPAELAPAPAE